MEISVFVPKHNVCRDSWYSQVYMRFSEDDIALKWQIQRKVSYPLTGANVFLGNEVYEGKT